MRGLLRSSLVISLLACAGTAAVVAAVPADAQGSYSPYNETATAALARYVRTLATDPKSFEALIGAGRAALELGDPQAASGFFARADEVNPRSPLPQAGMGAVSVADGEPMAALPYFTRAQQLGASLATFACDRGLAFDLLGRQADAQRDYRTALDGPDRDEARRRLALSLAISGNRAEALNTLSPLTAERDVAAARTRAFVLALTGDSNGAMAAIDAAMPGTSPAITPLLQRLPVLAPAQKAAAVNLGIFPDAGNAAYAYSAPMQNEGAPSVTTATVTTERLAGVDELLRRPAPIQPTYQQASISPAPQRAVTHAWPAPTHQTQVAYSVPLGLSQPAQAAGRFPARKIWLQLASGSNAAALPGQFQRMRSQDRELFDGIPGYVAKSPDRARLVIGPFRSVDDADTFAADLETAHVNAFKWSNSESDQIVPLGTP
jgi:Flp pilus assembly protein TadD